MTKEEIVVALLDDMEMPYLQDWQVRDIVDFVIKNYQSSLPSNLDEAARIMADECLQGLPINGEVIPALKDIIKIAVRYGAEWLAGQGVTKETVIGMATEEISINVSQQTLDELDLCPGDKVVVQIRKK